jgi:hypothetical protein
MFVFFKSSWSKLYKEVNGTEPSFPFSKASLFKVSFVISRLF